MEPILYRESILDIEGEANFLHQRNVENTAPIHTHEFFEIFLVIKGRAVHIVNDYVQKLERGSLVFIRPSDIHCYDFYKSYEFEFLNMGFPKRLFQVVSSFFDNNIELNKITNPALSPIVQLNEYETLKLENKLKEISRLRSNDEKDKAKYLFRIVLAEIIYNHFLFPYEAADSSEINMPSWLAEVLQEMQHLDNFSLGLKRMIEISNCSQEHLNRVCKKYLGVTPTEIINEIRVSYTAYLLKNSDDTIITICEKAGFGNLSHFYHLFKNTFQCSPREFREQ